MQWAQCCTAFLFAAFFTPAGNIMLPALYLFQSTSDAFYAVARDQTGCGIPKLSSSDGWLLRGEIRFDDLPADVVVNTNTWGYCLLNRDHIKGGPY
jgi:hypothetical protein